MAVSVQLSKDIKTLMDGQETRLYKLNPQERFSDRATDYAKYRPSYPTEAIASILEGLPSSVAAADIGAGTGISSRLLADQGVRVFAIEPNEPMQQAATAHPLVEFRAGTAEHTGLPDASVDLVTCFQAFHWFEPTPTLQEFSRILKSTGRLAIVWNKRDNNDEFTQEYTRLIKQASSDHPAESRLTSVEPLLASSLFSQVRHLTFPYRQALNQEGLIGRTMSTSYLPREGTIQKQLISNLQELYNRFRDEDSFVYLVYCTSVYLAQRKD